MSITRIQALLRKNFGADHIKWLDLTEISLNGPELHLSFTHPYLYEWFRENIEKSLVEVLAKNLPRLTVVIHKLDKITDISHDAPKIFCENSNSALKIEKGRAHNSVQAESRNYFADFIYNEKNSLAVRAAHSLTAHDAPHTLPGVTVFFGPPGSGKTHLLKAIQQQRILSGDEFCPILTGGALNREFEKLGWSVVRPISRSPSLLLIDALQDMENSSALVSLICALCDTAINHSNNLASQSGLRGFNLAFAITADSLKLARLPEGIITRLEQGLCFGLKQADLDVRLRYGEKYNREMSLGLTRSQLVHIARHTLKITELRGLLHKIKFFVTFQGKSPALRDIENLIGQENLASPPDWQKVIENVAKRFTLTNEDILGNIRKPDYVLPRQIAMYLARSKLALSFQEIGKLFGGKDHSTVMHSVKKIQHLRQLDKDMHKLLTELENSCG